MGYRMTDAEIRTRARLRAMISEFDNAQVAADRQLQTLAELGQLMPPGPGYDSIAVALDEVDTFRRSAIAAGGLLRSAIERGPLVVREEIDDDESPGDDQIRQRLARLPEGLHHHPRDEDLDDVARLLQEALGASCIVHRRDGDTP